MKLVIGLNPIWIAIGNELIQLDFDVKLDILIDYFGGIYRKLAMKLVIGLNPIWIAIYLTILGGQFHQFLVFKVKIGSEIGWNPILDGQFRYILV